MSPLGRGCVKTRSSQGGTELFSQLPSTTDLPPSKSHYRGRDASYLAPPAQIRTGPIRAYGSHLGCLTAKRLSGHGRRIRGCGSQSSANRLIPCQVVQSFWLRCRSVRRQRLVTWNRNAVKVDLFVGTAW